MKYFLSIAVAMSLFSTSLSATFTFVYSPSQLVSNVNQLLYLWEDEVGAVGSPLLSDADFSSTLNSSSFSFTISGLSYGSGTFNELETKIINDEVVFSFSLNDEEYTPLDKSSFFVSS